MSERHKKPGPRPKKLRIHGDWIDALRKAVQKPRPKDGWPKPPERQKKSD